MSSIQRWYRRFASTVSGVCRAVIPESATESTGQVATDGGTVVEETSRFSDRLPVSRDFVESLPFWVPAGFLILLFVYGAIIWNLIISLTDYGGISLTGPDYSSLDLAMYRELFSDPTFWTSFQNTVVLLVVFTVACLVLGLLLAILVDQQIRFENTFRTIYLLPMSLSFVVTAAFWKWVYNPSFGLINTLLGFVGLDGPKWLSNPDLALGAVIFALLWQFSGYAMVVYLAGLRAIPIDQYEAARVDGASTIRMYIRVIVPQLRASTISAAVVLMVFALKAFDFIYVLGGKNPGPAIDILAVMMYRVSFARNRWAYGAAVATVLFALALLVIGPYLYSEYRRGEL